MKQKLLPALLSLILMSAAPPATELIKRSILDDKVEILMPKEFELMSNEMLSIKYPSSRKPTLVYTDQTGGINVAFNHTTNKASQAEIEAYRDNLVAVFKTTYPSAEWKNTGVKEINGRKVGYMELVTPAIDTKIYNLLFFTDLDGRLLLCTFNCVEKKQGDWNDAAHQIMNSLTIR